MKIDDLPPHRRALDCTTRHGIPHCMGAAARGDHYCTCRPVNVADERQCLREAWGSYVARAGKPCADCAFLKGSPEEREGKLDQVLQQDGHFYCHQGMPVNCRGGEVHVEDYMPPSMKSTQRFPVCAGYLAALKARVRGGASS